MSAGLNGARRINKMDGTPLDIDNPERLLSDGIDVLRNKHKYIKQNFSKTQEPNAFIQTALDVSPDLAKIAFGTNLTAATLIVEGGQNFIDQFFTNGFEGGLKGLMAPIMNIPGMPQRKRLTFCILPKH